MPDLQNEYTAMMQHFTDLDKDSQWGFSGNTKGFQRQIDTQKNQWLNDWNTRNTAESNTGYDAIMGQAQKAFDPAMIQKYYDVAGRNLNQSAANTGAYVGRQAGAHSTNMVNPSQYIMNQISKSQAPYIQQQGQLAEGSAKAQQGGAEGLTNLMYLLQRAKQGDQQAAQQLQLQYSQMTENNRRYQQQYEDNQASPWDYILGIGGAILGGPIGAGIGASLAKGSSSTNPTVSDEYMQQLKQGWGN